MKRQKKVQPCIFVDGAINRTNCLGITSNVVANRHGCHAYGCPHRLCLACVADGMLFNDSFVKLGRTFCDSHERNGSSFKRRREVQHLSPEELEEHMLQIPIAASAVGQPAIPSEAVARRRLYGVEESRSQKLMRQQVDEAWTVLRLMYHDKMSLSAACRRIMGTYKNPIQRLGCLLVPPDVREMAARHNTSDVYLMTTLLQELALYPYAPELQSRLAYHFAKRKTSRDLARKMVSRVMRANGVQRRQDIVNVAIEFWEKDLEKAGPVDLKQEKQPEMTP